MALSEKSTIPLRILIVEDSEDDADLIIRHVRKAGYEPVYERVESADELRDALAREQWDTIISDFSMPQFDGITALNVMQEGGFDLPFILVSGTITDEIAVRVMKAGAHDFIAKNNLSRLIPAIEREMREVDVRSERRRMEAELKAYHASLEKTVEERTAELEAVNEKLRDEIHERRRAEGKISHLASFPEMNPNPIVEIDTKGNLTYVNPALRKQFPDLHLLGTSHPILSNWPEIKTGFEAGNAAFRFLEVEAGGRVFHQTIYYARDLNLIRIYSFDVTESRVAEKALAAAKEEIERTLTQLRTVVENMGEGILVCDAAGRIVTVNPALLSIFDAKKALRGNFRGYADQVKVTDPEGRPVPFEEWPLVRALKGETVGNKEYQVHVVNSGKVFSGLYSATPVYEPDGRLSLAVLTVRDITERKRIEQALIESEERHRALINASAQVVYRMSPDWSEMLVLQGGIFLADTERPKRNWLQEYIHPDDQKLVLDAIGEAMRTSTVFELEHRVLRADGTLGWTFSRAVPVRNAADEVVEWFGAASDVTERKRLEEEVTQLAHHDPLTGLPNRRLFTDILKVELAQARRHQSKLAVLFLDLDRFKNINDSLGHEVGDELLKEVARRFRAAVRESDTVSRIGGDEFNMVMADVDRTEDIADFSKKILQSLRKPVTIDATELAVSTSIGISVYPDDSEDPEVLRRYADIAMYHAKQNGRNQFQFYNPSINTRSLERMQLESMLRRSIDQDELVLHYQPLVTIADRRLVCAEALVRWRHPDQGFLFPAGFLPLAEETGFITEIDDWALKTVCRQMRSWIDSGLKPVCVTVNLSSRRFQSQDLAAHIGSLLAEARVPPDCLDIEVTENLVMSDAGRTASQLRNLRDMGVHVSIDDFGTGYSSLNHLKRLPIERLKIDKSFIRDIADDADDRAIIHAVTAMAHTMKMKVVAEGVETEEQLAFLNDAGCDEMQGFLFSRPLPPEEFRRLVLQAA